VNTRDIGTKSEKLTPNGTKKTSKANKKIEKHWQPGPNEQNVLPSQIAHKTQPKVLKRNSSSQDLARNPKQNILEAPRIAYQFSKCSGSSFWFICYKAYNLNFDEKLTNTGEEYMATLCLGK
jgi:hypothetical protein